MTKGKFLILTSMILTIILGGCGLFSKTARLKDIEITIDGNPAEWEPFPTVHVDKKGDNISIEYDMSVIKAFTNNETGQIYILVESYIPPQEITSVEVDLQYGDEYYRVGLPSGERLYGAVAKQTGEGEWETVTDQLDFSMATAEATEMSFPIDNFPDPSQLKIAKIRIMGGICCNQYEYYAIDFMD
ncbi:MAG: hypothetical protein LLG42_05650 [Chloroflexi bacterium]|nr:hypothetical protein [Chloroflexota bacterium]